jgi:hypothetical protein
MISGTKRLRQNGFTNMAEEHEEIAQMIDGSRRNNVASN